MKCRFQYQVDMLTTHLVNGQSITEWITENRYYCVKIDLLPDNNYRKNFKFIQEL